MKFRKFTFLLGIMFFVCSLNVVTVHAATVEAVYGATPTIDGTISPGEWADASSFMFTGPNGPCFPAYIKQDGSNLYIGINIPDNTLYPIILDELRVCLDIDHDGGSAPQTDDYYLRIFRPVTSWSTPWEYKGNGGTWIDQTVVSGWDSAGMSTPALWQVELSISYSKLGITSGVGKLMGIEFLVTDEGVDGSTTNYYYWNWIIVGPPATGYFNPSTWGDITSTDYNWVPWFTNLPMVLLAGVSLVILYRKRSYQLKKAF